MTNFVYVIRYGSSPSVWADGLMDIQTTVERYTSAGNSLGLGGKLGGTDAAAAFKKALAFLKQALNEDRFKSSFPALVFHLTDGLTFTDPTPAADQIRHLSTADGNLLVVNAFIGTRTSLKYKEPADFPGYLEASEAGPSEDNVRLFNMSSRVPECIRANLVEDGIFPQLREGARLFFDVRTREMLKHVIALVGSQGSRADRMQR